MIKRNPIVMTEEERAMSAFGSYCRSNVPVKAKSILKEYPQYINLTECDGLFVIAIDQGFVDILNLLIDFYVETKLQNAKDEREYKVAYYTLQTLLNNAREECSHPSPEIEKILDQYAFCKTNYSESEEVTEEDKYWDISELAIERDSSDSMKDDAEIAPLTEKNIFIKEHPTTCLKYYADENLHTEVKLAGEDL